MTGSQKQESLLRSLGIVALGLVIFALVNNVIWGWPVGGSYRMYYGQGFGFDALLVSIIMLVVKLLWLVFVVSLTVGAVIITKKYFDQNKFDLSFLKQVYETKFVVSCCGFRVKAGHGYCPGCGKEITNPGNAVVENEKILTEDKEGDEDE